MDFFSYFVPENAVALGVITAIWILFASWIAGIVINCLWLRRQQQQMRQCADVRELAAALQETGLEQNKKAEITFTKTQSNLLATFEQFRTHHSLKEHAITAQHIKTIFEAGIKESRLGIGDLISYTSSRLFRFHGIFRAVLALFIVLGLLGTLFGLADSLAQLSPQTSGSLQQSKEILTQDLQGLLSHLRSAFAPSMLGILFTILGVTIYSLYLNLFCVRLKQELEHLTLTIWVPQLFPTTSQKLVETLALSEKQIHQNLESIEKVAEFSKHMQSEAGELQQSVRGATQSLKVLEQATTQINTFADKFERSVSQLIPFQQDLKSLYEQMHKDSQKFHEGVRENIKNTETFQQNAKEVFDSQNVQIKSLLAGLQSYEAAYIKSRETLDKDVHLVLDSADKAFKALEDRNKEVIQAVADPLRKELNQNLSELKAGLQTGMEDVRETLQVELKGIQNNFAKFDAPITKAVTHIAGSLENFDKRTVEMTTNLQREMEQQVQQNNNQLRHLKETNDAIAGLLQELAQSKQTYEATTSNLSRLSESFAQFGRGLVQLGQAVNSTGQYTQQLRQLEEVSRQVLSDLRQLASHSRQQVEQVQSVARQVSLVERDVSAIKGQLSRNAHSMRSAESRAPYSYGGSGRSAEGSFPGETQTIHMEEPVKESFVRRALNTLLFWR